jgi:hypothetical protein
VPVTGILLFDLLGARIGAGRSIDAHDHLALGARGSDSVCGSIVMAVLPMFGGRRLEQVRLLRKSIQAGRKRDCHYDLLGVSVAISAGTRRALTGLGLDHL